MKKEESGRLIYWDVFTVRMLCYAAENIGLNSLAISTSSIIKAQIFPGDAAIGTSLDSGFGGTDLCGHSCWLCTQM